MVEGLEGHSSLSYPNDPILQQHVDLERYLHLTQLITA